MKRVIWGVGVVGFGVLAGVAALSSVVGARGQIPARSGQAGGGTQVFLRLVPALAGAPVIETETADKQRPGAIAIQSYSLGMKNATTIGSATGGAGAGKAQFEPIELVKIVDRASPALFKTMAMGAHFKEATLTVLFNGVEYQRIRMGTAFITNITQAGGNAGAAPTETIRMVYGQLVQEFKGASGKETGLAGWNQVTNKDMPEFPK